MSELLVTRKCPQCKKEVEVTLDAERYELWQKGELIQNVWPELTSGERELIQTGFCPDTNCWEEYLK